MLEWRYSLGEATLYSPGGNDRWKAKSGGVRGAESLPPGSYTIVGFKENFTDTRYKGNTGKPWFCQIRADKPNGRTSLGIHPDGGPPGTEGCIGLDPASDTEKAKMKLKSSIEQKLRVTA